MIRAILAMVWAVLFLIVSMPVHLIYLLIGRFSTARRDRFMQAWVKAGFRVVLFLCGVRVTVKGKENIPKDRACVYYANHRSIFDVIAAYTCLPAPTGVLAKQELGRIPLLNIMMKDIYCLFLDRSSAEKGLLSFTAFSTYRCFSVFPEEVAMRTKLRDIRNQTSAESAAVAAA